MSASKHIIFATGIGTTILQMHCKIMISVKLQKYAIIFVKGFCKSNFENTNFAEEIGSHHSQMQKQWFVRTHGRENIVFARKMGMHMSRIFPQCAGTVMVWWWWKRQRRRRLGMEMRWWCGRGGSGRQLRPTLGPFLAPFLAHF